jgi:DNA-binding XRE family transcriptional regulator/predicted RNase H-like HicB family nuclease
MMLVGRIAKEQGPFWSAEVESIGAFTQGHSRTEAFAMLADLIETMVDRRGFKVKIIEASRTGDGSIQVLVDANEPALLAAQVLKYQREVHGLSLADVAKLLGASSRNAYASYEQGRTEPTLSKYRELLHAVAPEMALTVGPRFGTIRKSKPARAKRRSSGSAVGGR